MKLLIDSSKRFIRRASVLDDQGKVISSAEGDRDLLFLLDQALNKAGVNLKDLISIETKMEGESRVGVNIGVAAANALNYSLGLKKLPELKFPSQAADPFK